MNCVRIPLSLASLLLLFFTAQSCDSASSSSKGENNANSTTTNNSNTNNLNSASNTNNLNNTTNTNNVSEETAYVLYNVSRSRTVNLMEMGTRQIVHTWSCDKNPAYHAGYLLENGNLLRSAEAINMDITGGGAGGIVEEIEWDGTVVWSFEYNSSQVRLHHDIAPMPNGNVLMIAWEVISESEAAAAGRTNPSELFVDHIIEVEPTGPTTGDIVWEWHAWDHLVPPGASAADYPGRLDVNLGSSQPGPHGSGTDWIHINAIDYNPELDQIVIGSHTLNEFYVIDHSTTTAEAAGSTGGNSGRGGEILYRWGNPSNYGMSGTQMLYVSHNIQWIAPGLPGEGDFLIFNNGDGRPGGNKSSMDQITPPIDEEGNYTGSGPETLTWQYMGTSSFYSNHLSSAQRLPSGNTFACEGTSGDLTEVEPDGTVVWTHSLGEETKRATVYYKSYPGLAQLND